MPIGMEYVSHFKLKPRLESTSDHFTILVAIFLTKITFQMLYFYLLVIVPKPLSTDFYKKHLHCSMKVLCSYKSIFTASAVPVC